MRPAGALTSLDLNEARLAFRQQILGAVSRNVAGHLVKILVPAALWR